MRPTKTTYIFLALLVAFSSCKSRLLKNKHKEEPLKVYTPASILNAQNEIFTFDCVSIAAKANYKDANNSQAFSMNIRMKADSIIWISVTGLGFEVARAVFYSDSIFVLDRFNRVFYAYDYQYAEKLLQAPVNLHQLQQILVGNTPYDINKYAEKLRDENEPYLSLVVNKLQNDIFLNSIFRPSSSRLQSLVEAKSLTASYTNHQKVDKKWFPYQVDVQVITENSKPELGLAIQKVNTETIHDFPFSIPDKYKKGN